MKIGLVIRSETDADAGAIADLTVAAFSIMPLRSETFDLLSMTPGKVRNKRPATFDVTTALPYISIHVHGHRNPYVRAPRKRLLER